MAPEVRNLRVSNDRQRLKVGDVTRNSYDPETRTVPVTLLSADHEIVRYNYLADKVVRNKFSFAPGAVRTQRMDAGLPLLDSHDTYSTESVLGVIENMAVSPAEGITGLARFSQRDDVKPILQDVQDGILKNWSLGTIVHQWQVTVNEGEMDLWVATDHEPVEGSLCAVQADPGSQSMSHDQGERPVILSDDSKIVLSDDSKNKEPEMTTTTEPAPAVTGLSQPQIMTLLKNATQLGLPPDAVESVMASKLSFEDAITTLISTAATKNAKAKEPAPAEELPSSKTVTMSVDTDQKQKDAAGLIEYLGHKEMPSLYPVTDGAKRFMGYNAVDVCRFVLESNGVKTLGMPREDIVQRAMQPFVKNDIGGMQTTADFPNLLGEGLLQRSLLKAYERTPDNYSAFTSETTFQDTRTKNFLQIGNLGPLRKVLEAAEYKRVQLGESKEKLNIDKYGEIFALSLEAILNDDLSAFVRLPAAFAQAARLTEEAIVFGLLVANPTMLTDGVAVFHVDHGNVGTAAAPDTTGITDARTLMRKQKGLTASAGRLGIKPAFVINPVKYELGIAQIMQSAEDQKATTSTNIIPGYVRDMKYITSDVLDEANTQKWYAVADPAVMECIVVARLQGGQSFKLFQKEGWNVDGMEWKARHWFGAGIVDYRGLYYNPGV